jgi:DHA2 family methylenomycin A resistance protein-like MFS transporter
LGVLVAQLDTSVVNLALARLRTSLSSDTYMLRWFVDAYNLTFATAILSAGGLGDRIGRRRLFVIGIALFTVGSLACALAPNAAWLVAARAFTGLGAAFEIPATLALLSLAFPEGERRARALGVWASMNALAFAIGPLVGGVLSDALGWRSIFAVAIPFCIVALLIARRLPESRGDGRRLDAPGQTLGALALGTLTSAGMSAGAHDLSRALLWSAIAVVALIAFIVRERMTREPLVDLGLFRDFAFSSANAVTLCMTFGMYGMLFVTPLALQTLHHRTATQAGVILLALSVAFFLTSMQSRFFVKLLGRQGTVACGMAGMGFGCVGLALGIEAPLLEFCGSLVVVGIGLGLATGPLLGYIVERAPKESAGIASGVANAARMLGATVGVALLGGAFSAATSDELALRVALLCAGAVELLGMTLAASPLFA